MDYLEVNASDIPTQLLLEAVNRPGYSGDRFV